MSNDDPVNHPKHYGGEGNIYEVIKVLEAWFTRDEMTGFLKGNAIKCKARARKKGDESEDYARAEWYIHYLNEYLKRTGK